MDIEKMLLPCPFCGGDNVTVFGPVGWYRDYGISHSCAVFYNGTGDFTVGAKSKSQAIAAWNHRVERDVLRTRIEAMVEFRPGSEFHRGWSGALSAVLAMIEAMQVEPDKPSGSDHQDSA